MKKMLIIAFLLSFLMISVGSTLATAQIRNEQTVTTTAAKSQPSQAQLEELNAQANAKLESQDWVIYWKETVTRGKKTITSIVRTDVMAFSGGKVSSEYLISLGYNPSNYGPSLSTTAGGISGFETMQVNENMDRVFIKGGFDGKVLSGVISMRPEKGKKQVYNFSSVK